MSGKVCGEITYHIPNFNGCTVQVWEWMSNFTQHFIMDVIIYLSMFGKKGHRRLMMMSGYIPKMSGEFLHCEEMAIYINTLRPRQNGRHVPDVIFKCIFLNENAWILIKNSPKFVPKGLINNIPALVQIMAWRRPGDKPLSETVMVSLMMHICVARPQWVNLEELCIGNLMEALI